MAHDAPTAPDDEAGGEPDVSELVEQNTALRGAIRLLHEISNLVRSTQELEPMCYAVLTGVSAGVGLGMNRAAIFLTDEGRDGMLRGVAAVGPVDREEADRAWRSIEAEKPDLEALYEGGLVARDRRSPLDRLVRELSVDPRGQSPLGLAVRRGRLVIGEGSDDLDGLLDIATVLAAPLRGRSRVRGVLVADCRFTERRADPTTQLVFDLLADHAGRAVENAEHFERLAHEVRTDPLTGLGSRRSFDDRLAEAVGAALVDGPSVSLLLIDLDDFKQINDTMGHPAGDRVLAEVGRRLESTLRPAEAFRYGGDELAVLLLGVTHESFVAAADRLWKSVASRLYEIPGRPSVRMGCSMGGATLPARAETAEELIEAADRALLRAKGAGKNRIRFA